jgi:hypothetical protein
MGMSDLYGPADDTESMATIHAALDAGVKAAYRSAFDGLQLAKQYAEMLGLKFAYAMARR